MQPPGNLFAQIKAWAEKQGDISGVLLVGSHARGTARADSDMDLVILTTQPARYLDSISFAETFGAVARWEKEDWGKVTSMRVKYRGGMEVEFGFALPDWIAFPLEPGTRRVLSDGARIIFDREGSLIANGLQDGLFAEEMHMPKTQSVTIETLKQILDAFNRHDLDAIMEFFDEECRMDMPRGASPWGTRYMGKAQVREGLASRFAGIPNVHYGDDRHWVCGNLGASEWTLTGTTTAGIRLQVRGCDLWEFRDGKIIRKDSYWKIVENAQPRA